MEWEEDLIATSSFPECESTSATWSGHHPGGLTENGSSGRVSQN